MRLALLLVLVLLSGCKTLPPTAKKCFADERQCMLVEDLKWDVGESGVQIVVPIGFVTDGASVPHEFWSVLSPNDYYTRASFVHDYLYWTQACTKEQADNILLIGMKESEVPLWKRAVVYEGVHKFGQSSWNENEKERATGLPRIIPSEYRGFPSNVSWDQYRLTLKDKGVPLDPPLGPQPYCALGDSGKVPTKPPVVLR